jgi:aspartate aminotransferase
MMEFNPKIARLKPSPTLALVAKAKAMKASGVDVVSLAAGEPDFDPPLAILQAAHRALDSGKHKYTPAAGLPALREAIASLMEKKFSLPATCDDVVVSAGGKQALHNCLQALLKEGDEVLLLAPCWVSYPPLVELTGARSVIVPATRKTFLEESLLEKYVTGKTKMIIVNSPNNPSGQVMTASELDVLEKFVLKHDLWLVSDELYSSLVYEGAFVSPGSRNALRARTLTIGGFSKCYALTGWRLGFSVTTEEISKAITAYQSHTTANANSIAQFAVLDALEACEKDIEKMRGVFQSRRDFLLEALRSMDVFQCDKPQGAFYMFPHAEKAMRKKNLPNDEALAHDILEKALVAMVPGSAFSCPGYLRLSYAASKEDLEKALKRLADYFA